MAQIVELPCPPQPPGFESDQPCGTADVRLTDGPGQGEMISVDLSPRPYQSAARVGRAYIASAVNTIVLAYAGASLPLLILLVAGGRDVSDLLTSEFLAEEIVRSAVGTVGLVAAVPITTALAALVADVGRARACSRPEPVSRPRSADDPWDQAPSDWD